MTTKLGVSMGRWGMIAAIIWASLSGPAIAANHEIARWNAAEPETLDPQRTTGDPDFQVERDLFEGLTRFSPDKRPIPGIAESWDTTADGLTYIFHLRHDAKWSTGEPVTSADFVYTFRRLVDPATASADIEPVRAIVNAEEITAGTIKDTAALGVAAPDPYTFLVTLKHPQLVFLQYMAAPTVFALHRASIEKYGNEWTRPGKLVSSGPFTLRSWVPHDQIVLDKSPTYYDKAAIKIDSVRHVVSDDDHTALKRWQAGELDIAGPPSNEIPTLQQRFGDQLHRGTAPDIVYLIVNMHQAPLGTDRRLREALNLAIDREVIAYKVLVGREPAYSFVPPIIADYTPQTLAFKDMTMPERIARAKQLMTEAGYGPDNRLKIEITYPTAEVPRTMLGAIRQMWQTALPVEITLANEEFQVYLTTLNHKTFQLGSNGLDFDFNDAGQFLRIFETSDKLNNASFVNPAYDELIHQAAETTDWSVRRTALQQAERILMTEMPVFPLFYSTVNVLVKSRVQGWVDNDRDVQTRYLSIKE
jgi:oligopeptide transport system substrate-binding protein